jgi:hypothetical protein
MMLFLVRKPLRRVKMALVAKTAQACVLTNRHQDRGFESFELLMRDCSFGKIRRAYS